MLIAFSRIDWITIVTGPLGVIVSILGFGIAITQIRRVKSATEAATAATTHAARTTAGNMILFLIPDLQSLASDINRSIEAGEGDRLPEVLDRWRETGIRVRGLLKARGQADDEILAVLTKSFAQVTDAKEKIRSGQPLAEATKTLQRSIDKVIEEVGDLGGQMLVQVEEKHAP